MRSSFGFDDEPDADQVVGFVSPRTIPETRRSVNGEGKDVCDGGSAMRRELQFRMAETAARAAPAGLISQL
jgi:hypothetical protein